MSKVYVVQQTFTRDFDGRETPKFNLSPAYEWGEIVFCLGDKVVPTDGPVILDTLRESLKDITEDDFILPMGSSILIALTAVVASEYVANLNFLFWSGRDRCYKKSAFNLDGPFE